MNCAETRNKLDELIDFELSAEERREVREHITSCPACREAQDHGLLLKRLMQLKVRRPVAPPGLKSAVLREIAATQQDRLRTRLFTARLVKRRHVLAVAATLVVATIVAFFFLSVSPVPKLGHIAAAEGFANAYLQHLGVAANVKARDPDWESKFRSEVERQTGFKLAVIPMIPDSDLLGWSRESVGGHDAIRMDFRPRSDILLERFGKSSNPLVSVFLLPIESTTFSNVFLKELETGHFCQDCVSFGTRGTIYCLRYGDFCVATVANVTSGAPGGFLPRFPR